MDIVCDRSLVTSVQIDIYDTTHLNHSVTTTSEACHGEAVISASGSGLAAFVCGHATASASTIDIFVASSQLWIVAHRSASALATNSPLPRDYAGQSGEDGLYGTNANLVCVADKVILTSLREGSKGVSVEVFSGVDGSILSESLLSGSELGISPDSRRIGVDTLMYTDFQQYQRNAQDMYLSQRETRLSHDDRHDVSRGSPVTFDDTIPAYIDTDRDYDNKNDRKEDDRQETRHKNGRLRYTSDPKQFKTRGRHPMEDRDKDLSHASVSRTRSYMSAETPMRWKVGIIGDGDGAIVFTGVACVDNFWNCTSRTGTQPPVTGSCANNPISSYKHVDVYENADDPLLVTGSFDEYTWICCDANVLNPVICSVDTHALDTHTGTFWTSPLPLNTSDDIFEFGSGGSVIVVDAVNMSNSFWQRSAQSVWERVPTPHPTFSVIPLEGTGSSWPANVAFLPHTRATSKESVLQQSQSEIHFVTEVRLQQECVPLPNVGTSIYRACQVEGWSVPETSDSERSDAQSFRDRSKKDYKVSFYRETLSFNVDTGVWSQPTVVPKMAARRQVFRHNAPGNYGGRIFPSLVSSFTLGRKLFMVWQDMIPDGHHKDYISSPPPQSIPIAELIMWDVWKETWSIPVRLQILFVRDIFNWPLFGDPTLSWRSKFFLHASGEGVVVCQSSELNMCTNVDSSGVIQLPSAVIEVSTDSSTMPPSEVSVVFCVCIKPLLRPSLLSRKVCR